MAEKTCRTCQKVKPLGKFYRHGGKHKKKDGVGYYDDCKKCYNFSRSYEFLDYEQGKIKRLDSPEKQKIADRILFRRRVKKALRDKR